MFLLRLLFLETGGEGDDDDEEEEEDNDEGDGDDCCDGDKLDKRRESEGDAEEGEEAGEDAEEDVDFEVEWCFCDAEPETDGVLGLLGVSGQ